MSLNSKARLWVSVGCQPFVKPGPKLSSAILIGVQDFDCSAHPYLEFL